MQTEWSKRLQKENILLSEQAKVKSGYYSVTGSHQCRPEKSPQIAYSFVNCVCKKRMLENINVTVIALIFFAVSLGYIIRKEKRTY